MTDERWNPHHAMPMRSQRPSEVLTVENAFIESFNGRLRDECLNEHLFASLPEARRIIEEWRIDYNTLRPHTSLDGLPPIEFATRPTEGHNQN